MTARHRSSKTTSKLPERSGCTHAPHWTSPRNARGGAKGTRGPHTAWHVPNMRIQKTLNRILKTSVQGVCQAQEAGSTSCSQHRNEWLEKGLERILKQPAGSAEKCSDQPVMSVAGETVTDGGPAHCLQDRRSSVQLSEPIPLVAVLWDLHQLVAFSVTHVQDAALWGWPSH